MAWLCVNEDRQEVIVDEKPERVNKEGGYGYWKQTHLELPGIEFGDELGVNLPKGTIKKLVGKELNWKDEPIEYSGTIKSEKKKFNWRILALSIIWSLLLICLSDFAVSREGNWKWIAIGLITVVMSFVFYFGYKDVDIDMNSSYTEDEKDFFNK